MWVGGMDLGMIVDCGVIMVEGVVGDVGVKSIEGRGRNCWDSGMGFWEGEMDEEVDDCGWGMGKSGGFGEMMMMIV